jgi:hypothetical protein
MLGIIMNEWPGLLVGERKKSVEQGRKGRDEQMG